MLNSCLFLMAENIHPCVVIALATICKYWHLEDKNLDINVIRFWCSLLDRAEAQHILLRNTNFGDDCAQVLSANLKDSQLIEADLGENVIGSEGVRYLAKALKHSQIRFLDLSSNNIGDLGCKYLAKGLKGSQIEHLNLESNGITDHGAIYLAEALKTSCITKLNLCQNNISVKSAELIGQWLKLDHVNPDILLEIYDAADISKQMITQHTRKSLNNTDITIYNIDTDLVKYMNDNCKQINKLKLDIVNLEGRKVENLVEGFNEIAIQTLLLNKEHITPHGVKHLIKIFAKSRIIKLSLAEKEIGQHGLTTLVKFLKKIDPIDLDLFSNELCDVGICYLIPYLKTSNLRSLEIGKNYVSEEGFKMLAENLQYTKLVKLGLSCNRMGPDTAFNMAEGLISSSITYLNLSGNRIEDKGAAYLQNVFKNTQIAYVNLENNYIEKPLDSYTADVESNKMLANRICSLFDKIVASNHTDISIDFAIYETGAIDSCIQLIKMLNDNLRVKAHIIYNNLKFANEIDDLCEAFCEKFNVFINYNVSLFMCSYECSDLIDFIKKFEQANLSNIVQNFLMHEFLFYVDEEEEILHPFVYKMLHKYNMPLYNENLNPKKKLEIIRYFEQHPEIEESKEVIELLKS